MPEECLFFMPNGLSVKFLVFSGDKQVKKCIGSLYISLIACILWYTNFFYDFLYHSFLVKLRKGIKRIKINMRKSKTLSFSLSLSYIYRRPDCVCVRLFIMLETQRLYHSIYYLSGTQTIGISLMNYTFSDYTTKSLQISYY